MLSLMAKHHNLAGTLGTHNVKIINSTTCAVRVEKISYDALPRKNLQSILYCRTNRPEV